MDSYPVHEARASLSKLVDRALAGEPQRVTRRGRDAVVIVSEADWAKLQPAKDDDVRELWKPREHYNNLGELIVDFAENVGFREDDFQRVGRTTRPLGADFSD